METIWRRLTQWAADCSLEIAFNSGASAADITAAEATLGLAFPAVEIDREDL